MSSYTLDELVGWDKRVRELADKHGLDCYDQIYELCSYKEMLDNVAYQGMPSHYSHWSFGKRYDLFRTLYKYNIQGLPYELVINTNPVLAYLMSDNTLTMQVITMAHVMGHNHFFKNNYLFKLTRPELAISSFKTNSQIIKMYREDPSIGNEEVDKTLDAAHALALSCRRNLLIKKENEEEIRKRLAKEFAEETDIELIKKRLNKRPLEPEEDILIFLRDNSPFLEDWQRHILTIVAEQTKYFLPQLETRIMNEGWATYWHYTLLNELNISHGMKLEFLAVHNKVVSPRKGSLNPYCIGFRIFKDIENRYGKERMFKVVNTCRDVSFLREYLTEDLIKELNLFVHEEHDEERRKVTRVADEDGWQDIKNILLMNVGLEAIPVIKIEDANFKNKGEVYLKHNYDGRELDMEYAIKTLEHFHYLTSNSVYLETVVDDKKELFVYDGEKIEHATIG